MIRLAIVLALAPFIADRAATQLASHGVPPAAMHELALDVAQVVLPHPDVAKLMAEDEARGDWPYRYGAVIETALDAGDSGQWESLPTGEAVWRLRITSPGAESLGVLFTEYDLPAGGRLFLHDWKRTTLLGAFTRETRQPNGMLAVQPLAGDDLVVEYVQDASVPARPKLRIGQVIHDYRGILRLLEARNRIALGGGCLIDVNCPEGAPYRDIKRSVIMVLVGGGGCSAGLLNNTSQDGTPYFLTAHHCGGMANAVAVFGYESFGCGAGPASQLQTISGATRLADSVRLDSQLYRLSSPPPPSFVPFYAGWDRSGSAQPGPAISISHPSLLPKKLALANSGPTLSGQEWSATWDLGHIEGGSSGSPLFNGLKRVIGAICCTNLSDCIDQTAFCGRFDAFWDQHNLGQWLDPIGSQPQAIDGFDPFPYAYAVPYFGSDTNPFLYFSTSAPFVGATWTAVFDTSSLIPYARSTWIEGYLAPSSGSFCSFGEVLVDTRTPRLFRSRAPVAGGASTHSNAIPNDPLFVGLVVYTQGLIVGWGGVRQLTNGVELHLR